MMDFYSGKKVLLTGAASGLGHEMALQLSELEASLYLVDIDKEGLKKIEEECKGSVVKTYLCDLSLPEGFSILGKQLSSEVNIDVVIANAGVGGINPGSNFSLEVHQKIFAINFNGLVTTIEPFISSMIKRKNGLIIGISSLAGLRGLPMAGSYSSSKAAVNTFLESLRIDLVSYGVKVCTACPGFLQTKMANHNEFETPFKISAKIAAKKILLAASQNKKAFLFPLPMKIASLLNRLLPIFIYDFIARFIQAPDDSKKPRIF